MDTNIVFLKNKTLYDTLIEIKGSLSFKIELIKNDINKNLPVFEEKNLQYPIKVEHLIEKINIFLLKQKYENQSKIKVSKYNLDCNSRNFSFNEKKVKLTEKEVNIILFLIQSEKPKKILELQEKVWGYSSNLETHTVETHIYRLRKKILDTFDDDSLLISSDEGYLIK
tara:strand:- start:511 stop:1017 length:507 start_codon:yes stop_codon:yes gene_type:complete